MGSDTDWPAADGEASALRSDPHSYQHTHKHSANRADDRSGPSRRVEVIIGGDRRRRWPAQEKARITAESFEPGASVSDVARRNSVSLGLLHYWRRHVRAFGQSEALEFIPVKSAEEALDAGAPGSDLRDHRDRNGQRRLDPGERECGRRRSQDGFGGGAGKRVIAFGPDLKILVASQPVDFRRGINGLVALVAEALKANPYCGDIFVFRSKRADRLKLIAWDGSGMLLVTKWLEDGRFTWPPVSDGVVRLSHSQMAMLVGGLDWTRVTQRTVKRPTKAG